MESVADIGLQQGMEQELNELEQLLPSDSQDVLERVGEKLTDWEQLVKATHDFSSALRIGGILEKLRQNWLALAWYQWIATEEGVDGSLLTTVMRVQGRVQISLGLYVNALTTLKGVQQRLMEEEKTDTYDYAFALHNIAVVYNLQAEYQASLEYAHPVLNFFEEQGDRPRASIVKSLLGSCYHNLKKFEESYKYYTDARDGLEECKDYFALARNWHNYAELMSSWGRMEEALAAWRMSHEMKKKTGDVIGQVNTMLSMGEYLNTQRDWHSALRYCTQAIAICHQHHLYDQEVQSLKLWSELLYALGRYSELEVCAVRATHLVRHVTKPQEVVSLLQKVAHDVKQIGRNDLAEQISMNAIQILG